jgi:hypothetical protein
MHATSVLASQLASHACYLCASLPLASHACYLCASLSEAGSKRGGAPASLLAARGLDGEGVGRGSCNGPPAHLAPARGGGQEHHLAGRSRTNTADLSYWTTGVIISVVGGQKEVIFYWRNIKESLSLLASGLKLNVQIYKSRMKVNIKNQEC